MAFADFDLKRAVNAFGLSENRNTDLFAGADPIEPNSWYGKRQSGAVVA